VSSLVAAPATGWAADVASLRERLAAAHGDGPAAVAGRLTLRHRLATLTGGHPRDLLALRASADAAVTAYPDWPDLRLLQGSLALALHRPDRACTALGALAGIAGSPPVQVLAADLARSGGDYARAGVLYRAADGVDPQWSTRARLAALAVETGDLGEAGRWYAAAEDELTVKQLRAFAWVRVQRGDLALSCEDHATAGRCYDDADAAYPGWWYVAARRAALDAAAGRTDDAVAGYGAVLAVVDRPDLREAFGRALTAHGAADRAGAWVSSAVEEYTASAQRGETHWLHHLAESCLDRDPSLAVAWARRDVAVRRCGGTLSLLAWCLHRAGRRVEAWRTVQEAFSLGAGDPVLVARGRAIEGTRG
jgi:tetratricopeptide (TPR) repeat protein